MGSQGFEYWGANGLPAPESVTSMVNYHNNYVAELTAESVAALWLMLMMLPRCCHAVAETVAEPVADAVAELTAESVFAVFGWDSCFRLINDTTWLGQLLSLCLMPLLS